MQEFVKYFDNFWQDKPGLRQVCLWGSIFFTLTLILALNRYFSFYTTFDHGLFNQLFWNSIRGNLFQGSLSSVQSNASLVGGEIPTESYIHLGQHFVINFFLWMPLYSLFPSPITLIVLQVGLITAAGVVLYALARHYLSVPIALAITASYYGANAVIGPTLDNFYEQCQLPLFIFSLLLALEKRKFGLFWLLFTLTLFIREETGITLFGIGAYLVISRRYPRLGSAICLLSFAYVTVVTNVFMRLFSDDNSKLYLGAYFQKFVNKDNPTTLELLWAIITQPHLIIQTIFTDFEKRLRYVLGLWLPLSFIPAISLPAWIMAAPPLIILLLQVDNKPAFSINTRYTLSIMPVLIYGVILWWAQNADKFKPRWRRIWMGCIALSLFFTVTSNPHRSLYFITPFSIKPWVYVSLNTRWQHAADLQQVIKTIPKDASVATTGYIIPHLSSRRQIVRLPFLQIRQKTGEVIDIDYALFDMWQMTQHNLAAPVDQGRLRTTLPILDNLISENKYGIIQQQNGVFLFQKGVISQTEALSAWVKWREELRPIWNK